LLQRFISVNHMTSFYENEVDLRPGHTAAAWRGGCRR
jgi:hypothetical protein